VNTDAPWPDLDEAERRVLKIQTKLHQWAVDDPDQGSPHDPTAWTRGEPDAVKAARPVRRAEIGRPTAGRPQGVLSPTLPAPIGLGHSATFIYLQTLRLFVDRCFPGTDEPRFFVDRRFPGTRPRCPVGESRLPAGGGRRPAFAPWGKEGTEPARPPDHPRGARPPMNSVLRPLPSFDIFPPFGL